MRRDVSPTAMGYESTWQTSVRANYVDHTGEARQRAPIRPGASELGNQPGKLFEGQTTYASTFQGQPGEARTQIRPTRAEGEASMSDALSFPCQWLT